jgi:hypothetical protein
MTSGQFFSTVTSPNQFEQILGKRGTGGLHFKVVKGKLTLIHIY